MFLRTRTAIAFCVVVVGMAAAGVVVRGAITSRHLYVEPAAAGDESPLPPPGVYPIGGKRYLIKRGYEQNAQGVCAGPSAKSGSNGVGVSKVEPYDHEFHYVECDGYVQGGKYSKRKPTSEPRKNIAPPPAQTIVPQP